MTEGPPVQEKMGLISYIALAIELSERHEGFPFPGITREAYAKIKQGEQEDPGYSTPIDILIERFQRHGMKIVLGKNPHSGNIFVLPRDSDDVEQDSLFPRHLDMQAGMDSSLTKLISANKLGVS